MAAHKKKEEGEEPASLPWAECTLQTYSTANGQIDYFVVVGKEKGDSKGQGPTPLMEPRAAYLRVIEKDFKRVKGDIAKQATTVQDFGGLRSAAVP